MPWKLIIVIRRCAETGGCRRRGRAVAAAVCTPKGFGRSATSRALRDHTPPMGPSVRAVATITSILQPGNIDRVLKWVKAWESLMFRQCDHDDGHAVRSRRAILRISPIVQNEAGLSSTSIAEDQKSVESLSRHWQQPLSSSCNHPIYHQARRHQRPYHFRVRSRLIAYLTIFLVTHPKTVSAIDPVVSAGSMICALSWLIDGGKLDICCYLL